MKYSKIVYIRFVPISKFVYDFLEIENLLTHGVEVEYLDTSMLYTNKLETDGFSEFKGVIKVSSHKILKEYLSKQNTSNTIFINLSEFNYKSLKTFYLLNKYNCTLGFFARFARPVINLKTTFKQKLTGLRRKLKNRIGIYIASLFKNAGKIKIYDYVFVGGSESVNCFLGGYFYELDRQHAKIINVNANDYDKFLSIKKTNTTENEPYCVFLDQYIPYHPDFILSGKKTIDPNTYYESLNRTLDVIEKMHNTKIVIAAHPKATNYREINPFNSRTIVYDKTPELVSNSQFVLAHYSTSVNFAIMYNKPLIYLISNYFEQILTPGAMLMKQSSETLGSPLIYFDNETIEKFDLIVNSNKYLEYKYRYMTSPESENKSTIDILLEFLTNP